MSVTKEQVQEKAKEFGVVLTDDTVDALVKVGVLPSKADSAPPAGDEGDDGDTGDKDGVQKRIRQLNDQRKQALADKKKSDDALKVLLDEKAAREADKDKEKGNWEKLNKEAVDAKAKADARTAATTEKFKTTAIQAAIQIRLLSEGVPQERIQDALKLIDIKAVEFTWTNEDALEYEIETLDSVVEKFKKEKSYLFGEGNAEPDNSGFQGGRPPRTPNGSNKDKKAEEIRAKFPSLR